jgi:ADP-heptose:LPS heptosyltransferase
MKPIVKLLQLKARQLGVFAYTLWIAARIALIRIRVGRRLLILMRSGGLGDIIASIPAINALRRQYADRHLIYLTRPEFLGIRELGLAIDTVLPVYQGDAVVGLLRRFSDVRSLKYLDELPAQQSTRHFILEMAESVGADLQGHDQPSINVEPVKDDEFQTWFGCERGGRHLLAIHTGPTAPVREWPPEKWMKLCELLTRPDLLIVELGVGRHFLHGAGVRSNILPALRSVRNLSILESARLLRACDFMIGIDSGPLHLAAAVGTHSIGLFGPVDPRLRAPTRAVTVAVTPLLACQFCHHQSPRGHWNTGCVNDRACMHTLTVESVFARFEAWRETFQK